MPRLLTCPSCGVVLELPNNFRAPNASCAACGGSIPVPTSRPPVSPPAQHDRGPTLSAYQIIGLSGLAVLLIGAFLPIVRVPLIGTLNYFHNGWGDGVFIVVFSLLAAFFSVTRRPRIVWVIGLLSVALLAFTFTNFYMAQLSEELDAGSGMLWAVVELQWGWPVLVVAACSLVAAGAAGEIQRHRYVAYHIMVAAALSVLLTMTATGLARYALPAIMQRASKIAQRYEESRRQAAQEALDAERRAKQEADRLVAEQGARERAEREAAEIEAARNTTLQNVIAFKRPEGRAAPGVDPEWADASREAVQQGKVRVRISELSAEARILRIKLLVENVGDKADVAFAGWGSRPHKDSPRLMTRFGKFFSTVPVARVASQNIRPQQSTIDLVAFEVPPDVTESLHLELPASAFNGRGMLRLEISKTLLLFYTASAKGSRVVPEVRASLRDADPRKRVQAIQLLAAIGPDAGEAIGDLETALKDGDATVRAAAIEAIAKMGPAARNALEGLLEAVGDGDEHVRRAAIALVNQLAPFDTNCFASVESGRTLRLG
jgi:hypothetical protein